MTKRILWGQILARRAEGNKAAPHIDMKAEKWYILTSLT